MRRLLFAAALIPMLSLAQTPAVPFPHPAFPTGPSTPLGVQVEALVHDPSVSRAHWGVAVTALDGTPIYGYNEGQYFRPASNNKIYTTAVAVALLGPSTTTQTHVFGALDPATGVVSGNLTLLGAGDANFGGDDLPYIVPSKRDKNAPKPIPLHDLVSLADQIVAKGVKSITGTVVGDDTLFPYEPVVDTWGVDDLVWGYGAPVSALTVADNQLKMTITPGAAGAPASVVLDQFGGSYYVVESDVRTVPAHTHDGVQIERRPGSLKFRVYGTIAADSKPDVEYVAIEDPAMFSAQALAEMLRQRGVKVSGASVKHRPMVEGGGFMSTVRAPETPADSLVPTTPPATCSKSLPSTSGTVLASVTSAPLIDDATLTNKISQNLHAELFLHRLGRLSACGQGSTADGARIIRQFWMKAGLDPDDFILYDGSGLSSHDLITPRTTAQLLKFAAAQPWFSQWKSTLPVGGEDGGVAARFPAPPLKDHVFAKTGTLGESRALSGYLDAASGKQVIFSIIVDTHTPTSSADRATMDKIVAAIAAAN